MARVNTFALAMLAALAVAAVTVVAQDYRQDQNRPQQPLSQQPLSRQPSQQPLSQQSGVAGPSDAMIANCIIVDNQTELALGKLAEQHAKSNDVKQFAEQMVKDHGEFQQQLSRFAQSPSGAMTRNEQAVREGAQGTIPGPVAAADRATQGGAQPQAGQGPDFLTIKRQINQKFLELASKDLAEKQGTQFDKCYIGSQVGGHMQMIAALEVVRNYTSPELAGVIDKGLETAKTHLEHAQKLAKELDRETTQETAQRDSGRRND